MTNSSRRPGRVLFGRTKDAFLVRAWGGDGAAGPLTGRLSAQSGFTPDLHSGMPRRLILAVATAIASNRPLSARVIWDSTGGGAPRRILGYLRPWSS